VLIVTLVLFGKLLGLERVSVACVRVVLAFKLDLMNDLSSKVLL
jgi:hypothetical protein